jgi:hypothetical protein
MAEWCENQMTLFAHAKKIRAFISCGLHTPNLEQEMTEIDAPRNNDFAFRAAYFDKVEFCLEFNFAYLTRHTQADFDHLESEEIRELLGCDGRTQNYRFDSYPEEDDKELIEYHLDFLTAWRPPLKLCKRLAARYECAVLLNYALPAYEMSGSFACHFNPKYRQDGKTKEKAVIVDSYDRRSTSPKGLAQLNYEKSL